jgi:hypothetical protein
MPLATRDAAHENPTEQCFNSRVFASDLDLPEQCSNINKLGTRPFQLYHGDQAGVFDLETHVCALSTCLVYEHTSIFRLAWAAAKYVLPPTLRRSCVFDAFDLVFERICVTRSGASHNSLSRRGPHRAALI